MEKISKDVLSNFVKKIGGPYERYGERMQQYLSNEQYSSFISTQNYSELFSLLQIENQLHQNLIQRNLEILRNSQKLQNELISPPTSSPSSSSSPTAAASTLPFPKHGIALSAIDQFIESCGGIHLFTNLTTTEVNIEAQKPFTYLDSCSYCDYLTQHNLPGVSQPIVFISHAWKYKFLDVMDAIRNYFLSSSRTSSDPAADPPGDPIIWFDLFTNNQHDAPDLDFTWWSTTFQQAIHDIGTTVMVLSPWSDPIPLTRAWCLYEIYCTIHTQSVFEIAMSSVEKESFVRTLGSDLNCVKQLLSVVNVERSEAWNPLDLQRIFEIVQKTVGFNEINSLVSTKLREWILTATEKAYREEVEEGEEGEERKIELGENLGLLYLEFCRYPLAEEFLSRAYQQVLAREGGDSENTLRKMNNLAILYEKMGNYETAIPLFQTCVEKYENLYRGSSYSNAFLSKNSLALCLMRSGEYQQALDLFQSCSDYFAAAVMDTPSPPPSSTATATAASSSSSDAHLLDSYLSATFNLAVCHDYLDQLSKALELFEELYDFLLASDRYGKDHYETLRVMTSLGSVYERIGGEEKTAQALEFYRRAYETKGIKFGLDHVSTLTTGLALGKLLSSLGLYREAIPILTSCYESYGRLYGNEALMFHSVYHLVIALLNSPPEAPPADKSRVETARRLCEECLQLQSVNPGHQYFQFLSRNKELCEEISENLFFEQNISKFPSSLSVSSSSSHEHPLELTQDPYGGGQGRCVCDVCERIIIGWLYHCELCQYDCHPRCVLSPSLLHPEEEEGTAGGGKEGGRVQD
jgi:tetratricopeptide (TPR) repeat protein